MRDEDHMSMHTKFQVPAGPGSMFFSSPKIEILTSQGVCLKKIWKIFIPIRLTWDRHQTTWNLEKMVNTLNRLSVVYFTLLELK